MDASEWDALTVHMSAGLHRISRGGPPIVRQATGRCEAMAKQGAPVRTGAMKSKIHSGFQGDGRFAEMTGSVISPATYSGWVEDGTSRMAPQPFMRPALHAVTPGLVADAADLGGSLLRGSP